MCNSKKLNPWVSLISLVSMTGVGLAHDELEETVVIASRAELEYHRVIDSVVADSGTRFWHDGVANTSDALDSMSGVLVESTAGQRGGVTGIFIRGLRSNDTQFRLDGVRISNRSFSLNTVLGQLSNQSFDTIEVLKGGNSALYGAGATAGVVSLTTRSGAGERSGIDVEVGSFDSVRANLTLAGEVGKLDYFLQQSVEYTTNDTFGGNSEIPGFDNDFQLQSTAFRADYRVNDDIVIVTRPWSVPAVSPYALHRKLKEDGLDLSTKRILSVLTDAKGARFKYEKVGHGWVNKLLQRPSVPNVDADKLVEDLTKDYQYGDWKKGGDGLVSICQSVNITATPTHEIAEYLAIHDDGLQV